MKNLKTILSRYGNLILAIFHAVGLIGLVYINQKLFAALTPLILLISAAVIISAENGTRKGLVILLMVTFLGGYFVELIGIKTGWPFGWYTYGEALQPKLFGVPLVIGVNWFLLTMGAGYFIRHIFTHRVAQIIFASVLMVMLDVFIEPVAQTLDFWTWNNHRIIPILNFAGWFVVSLIMQWVFHTHLQKHTNNVATVYFIIVTIFFVVLNIAL